MEAGLSPHVVIVANDTGRFAGFSAHLLQHGFPCRVVSALPGETPPPGTIYFVSFNLNSASAAAIAKKLEQAGLACIVFAEEAGVQTAAKLSSAKMNQTLQHPYTEKNFLMAVQTIVKNRKAQFEKDERKRQHEERMKARTKAASEPKDYGLIIQEAPEALANKGAMVFKMDAPESFSMVQSGTRSHDFFVIQEGAKAAGSRNFEAIIRENSQRRDAPAHAPESVSAPPTAATPAGSAAEATTEKTSGPSMAKTDRPRVQARAREATMNQFWAVFGMCLIGSAVCLYCVYQILFVN